MTHITEGRGVLLLFSTLLGASFGLIGLLDPDVPIRLAALFGWLVVFGPLAVVLDSTSPHGRGKTVRSRARRRLASWLVRPVRPCGCFSDTGSDTVESDPFVARLSDGARVQFYARDRQLRRCHRCGEHYHTETSSRTREIGDEATLKELDESGSLGIHRKVVVWPEDEIQVLEALDAPVEDRD